LITQNNRVVFVKDCTLNEKINVGDTVIIQLIQYPGRGLSWELKSLPNKKNEILFVNKSLSDDQESMDDGSQKVYFKFLIKGTTDFKLEFEYRRPWESDKPPIKNCIVFLRTT